MAINTLQYKDAGAYYNSKRLLTEDDGANLSNALAATTGTGAPTVAPNYTAGQPGYYVDQASGDFYAYNDTSDAWEKVSNTTTFVDNADGTYTFTDAEGVAHVIDTKATNLPYSNTTSGLTATKVQGAIDEVDSNVDDVLSTLGTVNGDVNLGTFTGATIADNSTVKTALQALETKAESGGSNLAATTGTAAPTAAPNYAAGEPGYYVNQSTGDFYAYNDTSDAWEKVSNTTTFVDNADGTYTFTDAEGVAHVIDTKATNLPYSNTTSGLTATKVQGAIDELDSNIDDAVKALGILDNETDLGTFTGTTIGDGITVKAALQALETAVEAGGSDLAVARGTGAPTHTPTATQPLFYIDQSTADVYAYNTASSTWEKVSDAVNIANTPTGNLAATTVQGALNELQGDVDTINGKLAQPDGIATLDSNGKVLTAQLPALAITDVHVVADIAARDALTVEEGDVAKVTDSDGNGRPQTYIYDGSAWIDIQETSDVMSVFGRTGVITATAGDYTADKITYSNTTSGLLAVQVQAAIDELDGKVDTINAVTYTAGSVLFAGADGKTTQDNSNFFYDDAVPGLGLGTTSPTDMLDVDGTVRLRNLPAAVSADLILTADATTGQVHAVSTLATVGSKWTNDAGNTLVKLTNLSDGTTARPIGKEFVVTDAGKVGIGTPNPTVSLQIKALANDVNSFFVNNVTDERNFSVGTDGAGNGFAALYSTGNTQQILLGSSGYSYFNGGNVGINTTAPTDKLDVNGTVRVQDLPAAISADLLVTADATTGQLHKTGMSLANLGSKWTNDSANSLVKLTSLSDGTTARPAGKEFTVTDSGNVGIRTSVPASSLTIAAGDNNNTFSFEGLKGTTTSTTLTEIFVQGVSGSRISIPANSVADFVITVVGKDTVTGNVGIYKLIGGVKSNASGVVSIVGSPTKQTIAEDTVTWDVAVAADDANDALAISVQADSSNSVNWVAKGEITMTKI